MKRLGCCLLGLLFVGYAFAQPTEKVLDDAFLKCQYRHTYLKDTLDIAVFEDLFILQIGKNNSKWYSYYTFQNDSLKSTPDGQEKWKQMFDKALEDWKKHRNRTRFMNSFSHNRSRETVYKDYPEKKITVTDVIRGNWVSYKDTLNAQPWQMTDSTKEVLGYVCQQAVCYFRGRYWTAWFAPDIPISDGPWKFGGLPGLILEVYDRGYQYHFTMMGVEKTANDPIVFSLPVNEKAVYKSVQRKEFLKAKFFDLNHSGSLMNAEYGLSMGEDKPVYRDLIERDYK